MGGEPAPRHQAPPAVISYPVNYSNPEPVVPLWQRQKPRLNKYVVYGAAGVVVLVMAGIFLSSLGPISWPWSSDAPAQAAVATGSPLATRSDFAVANRFLFGFLSPPLARVNRATAALRLSCNGVLSVGCQSALSVTDTEVRNMLSVVQTTPAPVCILPNVTRVKGDLTTMVAGLQLAVQSYNDNKKTELYQGLSRFYASSQSMQLDLTAAGRARTAYCDTQLTGP
jgi:hypothetical protein